MRILKTFWAKTPGGDHKLSNFGDVLTPIIFSHFSIPFVYAEINDADTFSTGSIAKNAKPNDLILGSGAMRETDILCPTANWAWVRGPRTRKLVLKNGGMCSEMYGDPALLLPLIVKPNEVEKIYDIGIVPHVRHYAEAKQIFPNNYVINLATRNPIDVLKEILKCKKIISSSLHGIVVSHAYNIPVSWVKFSTPIAGDDIKFYDHYESIGLNAMLSTLENLNFSVASVNSTRLENFLKKKEFL